MKMMAMVAAVLAFLGFRLFVQHQLQATMTSATTNAAGCLSMIGNTTREENGATYIVGSFKNDCARSVGQVTIIFKVDGAMDSNFNHRDSFFQAYERDVAAGETRNFKTLFSMGKNATYRFDSFNAF